MFGKEFERFDTPADFLERFVKLNHIVGGLFISATAKQPDLIISQDLLTDQLYIWENFFLSRRSIVFLPVCVYETTEEVYSNSCYRKMNSLKADTPVLV